MKLTTFMVAFVSLLTTVTIQTAYSQKCGVYHEKDSMIVFEAEDFAENAGYAIIDDPTASGGKLMQSTKSGSGVHYYIDVKTAGRWNIYMRHFSLTYEDNGLYFQLDGKDIMSDKGHNIIRIDSRSWKWGLEFQCGEGCHYGGVFVDLTPGKHKFSIRKREIGCRSDKFCLAVKGKAVQGIDSKTGMGPAVSPCSPTTISLPNRSQYQRKGEPISYALIANPASMHGARQLDGRKLNYGAATQRIRGIIVPVPVD